MIRKLFDFIKKSPTASHTAATVRGMLEADGFQELLETEPWELKAGASILSPGA